MTPRQIADAIMKQAKDYSHTINHAAAGTLLGLADAFAEIADAEASANQSHAVVQKSHRTPDGGLWLSPECAKLLWQAMETKDDLGVFHDHLYNFEQTMSADGVEFGESP